MPKPSTGTANASTATGGKVWPMLATERLSGKNSAPACRVTKIASPTATTMDATVATATIARWLKVSASSEVCT